MQLYIPQEPTRHTSLKVDYYSLHKVFMYFKICEYMENCNHNNNAIQEKLGRKVGRSRNAQDGCSRGYGLT